MPSHNGTTSAYAEKSCLRHVRASRTRNYLRIRGEELIVGVLSCRGWELPPHTRRRDCVGRLPPNPPGTTSAYAEKRVCITSAR